VSNSFELPVACAGSTILIRAMILVSFASGCGRN
jgi:hypothetical protein